MSTPITEPLELSPAQIERMHRLGGAWRVLDADGHGTLLVESVTEHVSAWVGRDGRLGEALDAVTPFADRGEFLADWHYGPAPPPQRQTRVTASSTGERRADRGKG